MKNKEQVEKIIGHQLDWREMPNTKASRIILFKDGDPYKEADWNEQFAWLQDILEKFDKAFRPLFVRRG